MKTLQNNFTTPEQSERLLDLGVPADSADCYRWDFGSAFGISEDKRYSTDISVICYEYQRDLHDKLPCWSVGRLIEICLSVFKTHYFAPKAIKITTASLYGAGLIEDCVRKLEELHESYSIDFSKLNDYETTK